jgi:ribulose-phosphate 3-epimerase
MRLQISPSILSADFGRLNEEIKAVEKYADRLHVDVMDGHFVPNITIGAPVVKKLKSKLPIDCHLMIEHPEKFIKDFADAGAHTIIIHAEIPNFLSVLKKIRTLKCYAGICIKPKTKISVLTKGVMKYVDHLLIMSVEPGFGGQKFMPETLKKIAEARKRFPKLDIAVDGGINKETGKLCAQAGANILAAGYAIFGTKNYKKAIESMRK